MFFLNFFFFATSIIPTTFFCYFILLKFHTDSSRISEQSTNGKKTHTPSCKCTIDQLEPTQWNVNRNGQQKCLTFRCLTTLFNFAHYLFVCVNTANIHFILDKSLTSPKYLIEKKKTENGYFDWSNKHLECNGE